MVSGRRRGRSIGPVLAELRTEFPDLTVSKVRFLEAEGLVSPARTAAGYRIYAPSDVDRLRYVLRAQRDRFWPLKVIRDALDALDRGLVPAEGDDLTTSRPVAPQSSRDPAVPAAAELGQPSRVRLTRSELADAAEVSAQELDSWASFGLVHADADGYYDDAQLAVARAASALAAYGFEARHLRSFRTAAEREVGLVDQVLGPLAHRDAQTRADTAAEVAHSCLVLHAALVRAQLLR
ncbi:MAG TPA: MerR family transcriptional regulator [Dermatophilaceae bacterium]|nr:MerR family transcriptional regulator [Dermatophilaceae bacterium]